MTQRMKKWMIVWACMAACSVSFSQTKKDFWTEFAKTKFEPKYYEKLGEYLFYPTFPPELKALEGKEITMEGFYVPFSPEGETYIIISKYPMSQCFFCGGAGPESIAEVNFAKSPSKFQVDDLITIKGKLRLNTDNMDHVNFIIDQAVLVSK
jgi:hypothetical protein